MKKYFVDGKEITESEAAVINQKNKEYINSGGWNNLKKIKFITVINK